MTIGPRSPPSDQARTRQPCLQAASQRIASVAEGFDGKQIRTTGSISDRTPEPARQYHLLPCQLLVRTMLDGDRPERRKSGSSFLPLITRPRHGKGGVERVICAHGFPLSRSFRDLCNLQVTVANYSASQALT